MVLDLMAQLEREFTERNKIEALLRELLDAKRNRKSEQLSADQLALFAELLQARQAQAESSVKKDDSDDDADQRRNRRCRSEQENRRPAASLEKSPARADRA